MKTLCRGLFARALISAAAVTGAFSTALAQAPAPAGCVGGASEAGWIERAVPASAVLIERGSEVYRARNLGILCEGDLIRLKYRSVQLTYRTVAGEQVRVEPVGGVQSAAHRVGAPPRQSLSKNMLVSALNNFLPDIDRLGASTMGRGANDSRLRWAFPILAKGGAKIASGERALRVRWRGGAGPYTIALLRVEGGAETLASSATTEGGNAPDREGMSAATRLSAGAWRLRLTDGNGASVQADVVVDPAVAAVVDKVRSARGASAPGLEEPGLVEIGAAADALALARQDRVYSFEALQILAAAPSLGLERGPLFQTIACLGLEGAAANGTADLEACPAQ